MRPIVLSIPLLWLAVQTCSGQVFAFDRLGTREGLPASEVFAIGQDEVGALWVGTDLGASRYDGHYFDHYFYAADQRIGRINEIVPGNDGILWMAGENGLFLFHENRLLPTSFTGSGWFINTLLPAPDGSLWMGTLNGLYFLSASTTDSLRRQLPVHSVPEQLLPDWIAQSLEDPRIQGLAAGPNDTLFLSTDFFVFAWHQDSLYQIWGQPNAKVDIDALYCLEDGTLYWGCHSGFFRRNERGITHLPGYLGIGKTIFSHPDGLRFCSSDAIYREEADSLIAWIDPDPFELVQLNTSFSDREGSVWIGSWEGLLKASPSPFYAPNSELPEVYGLGEAEGRLLVGTIEGVAYEWTEDNHLLRRISAQETGLRQAEIISFHLNERGDLWMTTGYEGLIRQSENGLERYTTADGTGDNTFFFLHENADGRLLAGGDGGITEIIYDPDGNVQFRRLDFETNNGDYVVFHSCAEWNGRLFFGTDQGIFTLQNEELVPVQLPGFHAMEPVISNLINGENGILYAATRGQGLLRILADRQQIMPDTIWQQSLELPESVWLDLVRDQEGDIWAGSFRQLCRIPADGQSDRLLCFDAGDGFFPANYPDLHLVALPGGDIFAGCTNGLLRLDPSSLPSLPETCPAYLREVRLLNSNELLYAWNQAPFRGIPSLATNQRSLRFLFSGFSYRNADRNRYRYRLSPLESEWQTISGTPEVIYRQLPPGKYRFELEGETGLPAAFSFRIKPPVWLRSWFLLLAACFLGLIAWQIYKNRKDRRDREHQLLDLNRRMAETRLMAVRAQMNPHFIFNSLNAIQECILSEKVDAGYHYLSKFSRLLRLVLDYSGRNYIRLDQEIHLLELYLELEKMRFDEGFQYFIETDDELEPDACRLPGLLIQPFVENAIWHGLLPKKGKRHLRIRFSEAKDDYLRCTVEDNGIGREAARQRKAGQLPTDQHESKGMALARERLDAISQQTGFPASIEVEDLRHEDGTAAGTRIIILLPAV